MLDIVLNALSAYIAFWQAGYFFEDFGKDSPLMTYINIRLKIAS